MCLESKSEQSLTTAFEKDSTFKDSSIQEIILFIHFICQLFLYFCFKLKNMTKVIVYMKII